MEFFNPNVAGEMPQLSLKNQEHYVPCSGDEESEQVITPIPVHGDQLFEERARNVRGSFKDGDNKFDRLKGLHPELDDWHANVNLYEMEHKIFYKEESAGELGTTKASINRTRKTNASHGPRKKYNEYKDFHECELEGHICAAFLEMSGMSKVDDKPNYTLPDASLSTTTKRKWLLSLCETFIDTYVLDAGDINRLVQQTHQLELSAHGRYNCRVEGCAKTYVHHSRRVRHEISIHRMRNDRNGKLMDEYGYYYCRGDCGNVFSTKGSRNSHEKKFHPHFVPSDENTTEDMEPSPSATDHLYNYHNGKLRFGLILFEFNDAVQEGDGQRLHDLYKLALLLYKSGGHSKYACAMLLHLVKIEALYSEFEAFHLLWNRFYNEYGQPGGNISLDLKKEQLHKVLKTMWRASVPNLNQTSASRTAEAPENLQRLLQSFDNVGGLHQRKGHRSKGSNTEAVLQVVSDLMEIKAFKFIPGRGGHPSFPDFPSSIINLDYRDLHKWMSDKKKQWKSMYENAD